MKRIVLASLFCLLLVTSIAPVYASVTIEALIDDTFHVSFNFDFGNNSTLYDQIVAQQVFSISSIPSTIERNLEKQNLTKVSLTQIPANSFFNDDEKSIHIAFYLGGEHILSYTVDRTALTRTYNAKTNWIKFNINLTNTLALNFTKYFTNWQRVSYTISGNVHTAFFYNSTAGTAPFNVNCYFILPLAAKNIKAVGDTLTFEMPLLIEDRLIDSPILILGAIIIANIIAIIYRKVRK